MMVGELHSVPSNEHNDSKHELIKNKFHPKKTPSKKEDENSPVVIKKDEIVDWLNEGQKQHPPLRRKVMSDVINLPPHSPDTEEYGDDSIKEWIPTPHEKIKEDDPSDDYIANVSNEDITDWLAEGQKPHPPLRRKVMSDVIQLPPKTPDSEDYGDDSIKEWIPTPHPKIKEDDPTDNYIANVSNEEITDWLAEGQKKHEPLKRNKTRSAVDVEKSDKEEEYTVDKIEEWIPTPHPAIQADNDNNESYDNEVVSEWNP